MALNGAPPFVKKDQRDQRDDQPLWMPGEEYLCEIKSRKQKAARTELMPSLPFARHLWALRIHPSLQTAAKRNSLASRAAQLHSYPRLCRSVSLKQDSLIQFVHLNDQSECFKLLKTHPITNVLQSFHLLYYYLTLCQVAQSTSQTKKQKTETQLQCK